MKKIVASVVLLLTTLTVNAEISPLLKVGDTASDVSLLQRYLNLNGFSVALNGLGSLGKETEYFGVKTLKALLNFQTTFAEEIAPTGTAVLLEKKVSPLTFEYINKNIIIGEKEVEKNDKTALPAILPGNTAPTTTIQKINEIKPTTIIRGETIGSSAILPSRYTNFTLSASPEKVPVGGTTTLYYTTLGSISQCQASWVNNKIPSIGSYITQAIMSPIWYSINCFDTSKPSQGKNIPITRKVFVDTIPLSVSLTASNYSVDEGGSVSLYWSTLGATACEASWATSSVKMNGAFSSPSITTKTTYSLTCSNPAGQKISKNVDISVIPLTLTVNANPEVVSEGSSSEISWESTGASSCQSSWGISKLSLTGKYRTTALLPTNENIYSVMCNNSIGKSITRSVTVDVIDFGVEPPTPAPVPSNPSVYLSANPSLVVFGASTTVTWSSFNTISCKTPWSTSWEMKTSGVYVTPPLFTSTAYTIVCKNNLNETASSTTFITVVKPAPEKPITARDVGLLVNDNDPVSIATAQYYKEKRGILEENIIHLNVPLKNELTPNEFSLIKNKVDTLLPKHIQVIAVAWTNPSRVGCNSMTSAISRGYISDICVSGNYMSASVSPYYDSYSEAPYTDFGMRPSMMLAGKTFEDVKKMIDNGVASDNTNPIGSAYLMKTYDYTRSLRAYSYTPSLLGKVISPNVDVKILTSNSIASTTDSLFYFQGLATVPNITKNQFPKGAVADHLTSYGGRLTDSTQMSILEFIAGGVTGSYGTVVEPYAILEKFPDPAIMMRHYTRGETLVEAYWKSISQTAQGIFVGEPLAKPWAR